LVFEKKRQFFGRKLGKIAENSDHIIDPRCETENNFILAASRRFDISLYLPIYQAKTLRKQQELDSLHIGIVYFLGLVSTDFIFMYL
jgi:hypothetical protein